MVRRRLDVCRGTMSTSLTVVSAANDCWNRIGIGGDRTCPELETHIHCRSCPVFASAARTFFDRSAPDGYLAECTEILAEEKQADREDSFSVLLFRLADEWLSLVPKALAEVTSPRPVHRIPHNNNAALAGLVNVRGQLLPCLSLHSFLGVDPPEQASQTNDVAKNGHLAGSRMVVMENKVERWAFHADEVRGVQRIWQSQLHTVPSSLSKISHSYVRGVFTWNDQTVGILDEHSVFSALRSLGK
jgi:chemotaxis-related protein WspD